MPAAIVLREASSSVSASDWGQLQWFAGHALGNSERLTVGECTIYPGQENPLHSHPNCEEILHVLAGELEHTADGERYRLTAGDTITIPPGVRHNARNVGQTNAVMTVVYSSAERQMRPE